MTLSSQLEALGEAGTQEEWPSFDPKAFALKVRIAMAQENLSLRKLGARIGLDQATLHRVASKELEPSVSTYFRLNAWLESIAALREKGL